LFYKFSLPAGRQVIKQLVLVKQRGVSTLRFFLKEQ